MVETDRYQTGVAVQTLSDLMSKNEENLITNVVFRLANKRHFETGG